jgi:hypothetical protein
MDDPRIFTIVIWISLPTVMYGGYALLRLISRGDRLTPEQIRWFRAGHAHAGVLLLMALLYAIFLGRTALPATVQRLACLVLGVGILAQSGGFFIHLMPDKAALGTRVTITGAALLAGAVAVLVYGLIVAP